MPSILTIKNLSSAGTKTASRQFRCIATLNPHKDSFGGSTHRRDGSSGAAAALVLAGTAASTIAASFSSTTASGGRETALCEQPPSVTLRSFKTLPNVPVGGAYPFSPTHGVEIPGPAGIPSRAQQVSKLMKSNRETPYDVLVIGGGATGAGVALDAATRTGDDGSAALTVACIERGDFASETSSRSTKLIWAGIKYLASAAAAAISLNLITSPIKTVEDFYGEFKMVFNCHQERKFMMEKQKHLTNWVPIVCPFTEWHIWPPPFGHWLFSFFPILAPAVFKFYDGLSQFTCPPSFIMSKKKALELFPQLSQQDIKYCAVFYEGQHNDARTNLAIAMSAAEKGADIANYVEMTDGIFDEGGKVIGVRAVDRVSGEEFSIYAKNVIFAGGPFTDSLRQKEHRGNPLDMKPAVHGASGSHIVLPGYYAPSNMGLLDYNTSDGRFLFFLPWQGSVIVGTTDKKGPAETLPYPPEAEIQWMLKEVSKYLSKDLKVRRSDVLSAWRGWRPLAADPHAPPGGQVSRDHVISQNPETGVTFIAGGKWTTWREMAEDVLDKVLGDGHPKCNTLDTVLHGGEGYTERLSVVLIQKYGVLEDVAEHLVKTYGGRAWEVLEKARPTGNQWPRHGIPLAPHYPYIEAEVRFACSEYACTIEDILSRRTRLAFLNSQAAKEALPRIADIMAEELGWSRKVKKAQIDSAKAYLASYGGKIPLEEDDLLVRLPTYAEVMDVFDEVDQEKSGYLGIVQVKEIAKRLGRPLPDGEIRAIFDSMDTNRDGKIDAREFLEWFEAEETKEGIKSYFHQKTMEIFKEIDIKRTGYLDREEIKEATIRLGETFSDEKVDKIFAEMDINRDGKIQLNEFTKWMSESHDETGFRKLLSANLGLGGTGWLKQKSGGFLG